MERVSSRSCRWYLTGKSIVSPVRIWSTGPQQSRRPANVTTLALPRHVRCHALILSPNDPTIPYRGIREEAPGNLRGVTMSTQEDFTAWNDLMPAEVLHLA